jgi:large subunit ribosomal protein L32
MPVPAKRRSSSKGRRNRAHDSLDKKNLIKCPKCGKAKEPHHACLFCGTYKGKEVIKIKTALTKKKAAKK